MTNNNCEIKKHSSSAAVHQWCSNENVKLCRLKSNSQPTEFLGRILRLCAECRKSLNGSIKLVKNGEDPRAPKDPLGTTIELKTWPEYFEEVWNKRKTFEVRSTKDRLFFVGDALILREYNPGAKTYTGRRIRCRISYILPGGDFGIEKDSVVMALENIITEAA